MRARYISVPKERFVVKQYTITSVLQYLKGKDIAHFFLFLFVLPFALLAKIFVRDFWLVCEDENEARDNGYWLFKWIRENRPQQKIAYAINKHSPDYPKVASLGKVISFGTLSHWFWYLVADKNISSQKNGKPNAPVCYFLEVILKLRKNNRIFLQHGITKDDSSWLYYPNTRMRMFVTTATPEHDFLSQRFGYPEGYLQLLGMPRFDQLLQSSPDPDLILVMPSWRSWLGRDSRQNRHADISQTPYVKNWSAFLQSPQLHALLQKHHKRLIFYPHRNMQKFLHLFSSQSPYVEIADWKHYDVQDLLKRASVMITDYSSVYFDFAYMHKQVLFYQFDEKEFRKKQYQEGYWDYHNPPFGLWTGTLPEILDSLCQVLEGCMPVNTQAIDSFFPYRDGKNCQRCYDAIKSL